MRLVVKIPDGQPQGSIQTMLEEVGQRIADLVAATGDIKVPSPRFEFNWTITHGPAWWKLEADK